MLLYYITDRKLFPGSQTEQRHALLQRTGEAAAAGIDYIHLREVDLNPGALESLAREALQRIRESSDRTRLLIESRVDVAIAVDADGVSLSPGDINASDVRAIWAASLRNGNLASAARSFKVAVSCHSPAEVRTAESHGADFVVLSPIFDAAISSPNGLESLQQAALLNVPPDRRVEAGDHRVGVPVIASGGVTAQNAPECLRAGAAGLAGTRLFQTGDLRRTVDQLRSVGNSVANNRVARAPSPANLSIAKDHPREYRRRLPHFQGNDESIFVTFKTNGFVLTDEARDLALKHCLHDHGRRYHLHAAVVMPNHVHLLLRPLRDGHGTLFSLREIMQSLKGSSAHSINRAMSRSGPVWQEESWDRVVRSNEEFDERITYIEHNPISARLSKSPREYPWLWIAPRT